MLIMQAVIFLNIFLFLVTLLILFIDKVINRYGEYSLVINDDKELVVQGGSTLLKTLFENKYFIPSACGGKGTCGYCKMKVSEGGGGVLPTEQLVLSQSDVISGYRLSCQLKIKENLKVEILPEYLEIKEYRGTVNLSEPVTSDIRRIRIKLETPDHIEYKAGQYIQVRIPGAKGEDDFRAYSMASHPDQTDEIELNIKLIPEGLGSGYMHSKEVGDSIDVSGPYGDFYLHKESHNEIVCVAGGVGLAPLKSIIQYWKDHQATRPLYFFYGARTYADLYDHQFFKDIESLSDQFHYFPALSEAEDTWEGERGFIHTVIDKVLDDKGNREAYLCGPPIMIDSVIQSLERKKVPRDRIWYDKF